jgi:teichuronic acid biosynthesis glycosyltransferase TuaC
MKTKNLLVITSGYPFKDSVSNIFIKERVDCLKQFFNKIYVISPLAYFPKWATNLSYIKDSCGYSKRPETYTYDNVEVFFPKYFPTPPSIDSFLKLRLHIIFKSVEKTIKKNQIKFDLIDGHFITYSGYIGAKLKEKYCKPLILTGHGGDIYNISARNKQWLEITKTILKSADKLITVSQKNRDILINKLGVRSDKIKLIQNGFNPKIFKFINEEKCREELGLPHDKKIILNIGRLDKVKGHEYLIRAIYKVIKSRSDILCIIVGNGPLKKELNTLIKDLKLDNYIQLIGEKSHNEIPLWINACDLFVLPSLNEGFPTVIPEALSCGKPVIATNVGETSEIIHNDNFGYILEPKNENILAEKILLSLNKRWDTKKIILYAKNNYTWQHISNHILKLYYDVSSSK